jgi:hypothetical protein
LRLSHADGAKGRKDNAIKRCQALTKLYTRSSEYHRNICYLMALSQWIACTILFYRTRLSCIHTTKAMDVILSHYSDHSF